MNEKPRTIPLLFATAFKPGQVYSLKVNHQQLFENKKNHALQRGFFTEITYRGASINTPSPRFDTA